MIISDYNLPFSSLSLQICKDKTEADLWFAGLKVLISPGQRKNLKFDGGSDVGLYPNKIYSSSLLCILHAFNSILILLPTVLPYCTIEGAHYCNPQVLGSSHVTNRKKERKMSKAQATRIEIQHFCPPTILNTSSNMKLFTFKSLNWESFNSISSKHTDYTLN